MKTTFLTTLPKAAFGLGAGLLLTVLTMSSFKASTKQADVKWGNDSGTWVQLSDTDDYSCDGETGVCTATYPAGTTPGSTTPISTEPGTFSN